MEAAWAWQVLGLAPGAPAAEVRAAFRRSAQLLHPDRVADLPDDVRAEAQRRMGELAEAYKTCSAVVGHAVPRRPERSSEPLGGGLPESGGLARELLDEARAQLAQLASWDDYRAQARTVLAREDNAAVSRAACRTLEQVADRWPATAEGDLARRLLADSVAAANTLSARERAGHLVLVVDADARRQAWDALSGRDELAVAQVVHGHPTAPDELRRLARTTLAELDDWTTLAADADPDVRLMAEVQLLARDARALVERAPWVSRRERTGFDDELAAWRARVGAVRTGVLSDTQREDVDDAERLVREACAPTRIGRG